MARVRNVLFVMTDQLRTDYLSAYGHPTLKTPNIDALAAYRGAVYPGPRPVAGLRSRAHVVPHRALRHEPRSHLEQHPPCRSGSGRSGTMCGFSVRRVGLVGKTHMRIDRDGFARLGLDQGLTAGRYAAECGFEPFARDHGDYMGDHWLGEKEPFHEQSVGVPFIVVDPSDEAQAMRGTVSDALVESIDLVPTFVEALGSQAAGHRLEGCSLLPLLRGGPGASALHDHAVSELDYSFRQARRDLGLGPSEARAYLVATDRWKYVFYERFRPQLFDLRDDPHELTDLGTDPGHQATIRGMADRLFEWSQHRKTRVTTTDADVERLSSFAGKRLIGLW